MDPYATYDWNYINDVIWRFLIFSAYRIGVQVETWITALNVIVGALMILTLVQPWLGIIGLILALPVALINGQLIFFNINWIIL
ncbi:hypothetical protein ABHW52_07480 [Pediococcus pentosaceus]